MLRWSPERDLSEASYNLNKIKIHNKDVTSSLPILAVSESHGKLLFRGYGKSSSIPIFYWTKRPFNVYRQDTCDEIFHTNFVLARFYAHVIYRMAFIDFEENKNITSEENFQLKMYGLNWDVLIRICLFASFLS